MSSILEECLGGPLEAADYPELVRRLGMEGFRELCRMRDKHKPRTTFETLPDVFKANA